MSAYRFPARHAVPPLRTVGLEIMLDFPAARRLTRIIHAIGRLYQANRLCAGTSVASVLRRNTVS